MSDDLFKLICKMKDDKQAHCWQCPICAKAFKLMGQRVTKLERAIISVEESVDKNSAKIAEASSDIGAMNERLSVVEQNQASTTATVTEAAEQAEEAIYREMEEREAKKCNIVVHNMEEPGEQTVSAEERKKADLAQLKAMLQITGNRIDINKDVKFITRLGARSRDEVEVDPRPLLVGLADQSLCSDILSSAKNLADSDMYYISIVPDLTAKQRQNEAKLRESVKSKNAERTEEEAQLWEWRLIGQKGRRRMVKKRVENLDRNNVSDMSRGGTRGRGRGRGRGGGRGRRPTTRGSNPNMEPILNPRTQGEKRGLETTEEEMSPTSRPPMGARPRL